nr:MAG TPA: hypothetical protein [Caudoviricetes sp.]
MRIRGNLSPKPLEIDTHPTKSGYALVWLRDNVKTVEETDERGETVSCYEYDEYTIAVKFYTNLQRDVEANHEEWIETLKEMEFNPDASIAADMRAALAEAVTADEITAAMDEGVNSI